MSKINILSSKIFNRISAGEVIERPASVVKELVENSIDAGAKNISIEIIDGGITEIKITDDGSGIEKTEISKSILPHATSKISKVEDLDDIKTLGFRGEALASIVSVSKFSIETKTKNDEVGTILKCEGGDSIDIFESPSELGTTITVKNLFFNTPVRARFLKTPKSEENEITAVVARIILGNSNLKITYKADSKVIYQSFGEGLESAFLSIYGLETLKNCHFIQTEKNGIKIEGYISKPLFSKANRSYQTVFLNGRYILNQTISSSISNAYAPYLMKRQYPLYLLIVSLPNEYVDVNVHPNKIDVRFMNNQIVYGAIYSVITKVLDGTLDVLNIVVPEKKLEVTPIKKEYKFVNNTDEKFSFEKVTVKDSAVINKIEEKQSQNNEVNDIFLENKAYLEKLESEKKNAEIQAEIK
ncbi:MAG: DNA mismatch repair endonuclease MutL, partial [Firmicutes bacterium]|nr:DNA mismatch repair endonuclease MutL [Candidatus Caballimonas caccae]